MADNVAITAGSGTSVATDDVAGIHFQRVKLVDGAADSAAAIPGDAANGLDVDVTRVQGTVAVSAASLPLPSGAATAAKQPALGTAGASSADVITVQGVASMTALKVDGAAVTQPVSAASLPLPSGAATAAKQPAPGTAGTPSADVLTVQGAASMTALKVDGAAVTQPVSGTVTANLAAGTNTNEVVGDAAHGAAVAGNPVLSGREARTSDGTAVSNGQAVRAIADTLGKQIVIQGAVHDLYTSGRANITNTTAADVIAAAGAGIRIAVTSVLVTNAHATVATKVEIRDGTTVKIQGQSAAGGGGFALSGGGTPLFIATANTAVTARCATTGADVDVSISGYRIAN